MIQAAFYGFSALAIGAALFILFTRNVLYAAFCLFVVLLGVAALFVLMGADFLAIAQILIYVGGVLILLIFGIMLTHRGEPTTSQQPNRITTKHLNKFWGFTVALSIFGILFTVLVSANFQIMQLPNAPINAPHSTVRRIGLSLLTDNVLPFEIAGVLLLMALIGAAYVATPTKIE
ncbi:MAG: NADH-quinone oxidoreductase subunit J [Cytophagia bacterium]|nr:MAG: NADH-quinone oxidoreductase subunit J [Runella sp.]TAG21351.1 MAG: NADH-quinone oxidoreductase subunit J [Cytophagales bacterium]TAG40691.1 MAG: NADH-quinone oxidoreductase subunit J [Cytophagia bacterium]TAG68074.1 MAG: NADH-quinone oxidoreductase subunit J [Runella slithyformis]TAG82068.1 MAG: NADH-quinone oxidoreductase subunit J [Cytophagales bacterium]